MSWPQACEHGRTDSAMSAEEWHKLGGNGSLAPAPHHLQQLRKLTAGAMNLGALTLSLTGGST